MSDEPSIAPAAVDDGTVDDATPAAVVPAAETNTPDAAAAAPGTESDVVATGDDAGDAGAGDQSTPPETYADFTMPEGVELDAAAVEQFAPVFKDLGLTQDQAQKLVDIEASRVQASEAGQVEAFNQLIDGWKNESLNDSEFGGDKFEESIGQAQKAIGEFGSPELKKLLDEHGVGNHPAMVRFMVKVGQTLKEDSPGGGKPTGGKKDRVDVLYPTSS